MKKDLISLNESISGMEINKPMYLNALENHEIVSIDEILKNKSSHADMFEEKTNQDTGRKELVIKPNILQAEIYLLQGRMGHTIWLLGDKLNYIESKALYTSFGYESMPEMLNDKDFPVSYSHAKLAMRLNKQFDEKQAKLFGIKLKHIPQYLIESVKEDDMQDIFTNVYNMKTSEVPDYLKIIKHNLANKNLRQIINKVEDVSVRLQKLEQKEEREKENYFEIKLNVKKQVIGGKTLKLIFNSDWECQVGGMALDELMNRLEDRFIDILNRPENSNYLKKAQKEYKQ